MTQPLTEPTSDRPDPQAPIQHVAISNSSISSQPVPGQSAPEQTNVQHSERDKEIIPHVRFLLLLALIIFLLFSQNPTLTSDIVALIAILGISYFEVIFKKIDTIEPILKNVEIWIGKGFVKFFPALPAWVKSHHRHIINILVIIAALLTIFYGNSSTLRNVYSSINDDVCLRSHLPVSVSACNTGIGVSKLPNNVRIGLITNNSFGPFDHSRLNSAEMQVEADISQENSIACVLPHMTLAVVTMLSRTIEDPSSSAAVGLNNLRGAFLAQHDYNATHTSFKICLAIANLGTVATTTYDPACPGCYALPQVIKQLVQFAHHDRTFRGIVGFPYSQQTVNAIQLFQSWHQTPIPIVSLSATSDQLSNVPDFYRVVSSDQRQSEAISDLFCHQLNLRSGPGGIDIFTDDSDAYSSSLSYNFSKNLTCTNSVYHETYQTGNIASIQQAVDNAVHSHATYIFFPGYTSDLDTLEEQLQTDMQGSHADVTVLGGDGLYDIMGIAHNTFAPVYSSTYASPLLDTSLFVREYTTWKFPFPYLARSIASYTLLSEDAILAYDAVGTFIQAQDNLHEMGRDNATQHDFNTALSSVSFTGIGGYVAFQPNVGNVSDPLNKTVYIMCTDHTHVIHWVATYGNDNQVALMRDQKFCT